MDISQDQVFFVSTRVSTRVGTRILFSSFSSARTGTSEIWVQALDGSAAVNLSNDAHGDDDRGTWVPRR